MTKTNCYIKLYFSQKNTSNIAEVKKSHPNEWPTYGPRHTHIYIIHWCFGPIAQYSLRA